MIFFVYCDSYLSVGDCIGYHDDVGVCDNDGGECDNDNNIDPEVERNENDDIDNSYDYFGYNHCYCHDDSY